jgi:hypothetical protein
VSFRSPSAHQARESHLAAGLPPPPRCVLRFPRPLDALLPLWPPRACSIPVALVGFHPFRGFPPRVAGRLSAGLAPPDVGASRRPPSGVGATRGSVLAPVIRSGATGGRSSPGLRSSPGTPHATAHALHAASPRVLVVATLARATGGKPPGPRLRSRPGTPGSRSTRGPTSLFRALPSLLRFLSSSLRLPLRACPGPGSWFRLGCRAVSPPPVTLCGPSGQSLPGGRPPESVGPG